MPPKAAKMARPVVKMRYWTADAAGNTTIAKWLADELEGDHLAFFASFTNWSLRNVQRVKNSQTNWPDEQHKERAATLLLVLRTQPLNTRAYIRLLHDFRKYNHISGWSVGTIKKPEKAGVFEVMKGQEKLTSEVFSRIEREQILVAEGREHELSDRNRRRLKNRAAWNEGLQEKAARAAERAEAEAEKSALGQWGPTKEAVKEVEKEIAVDQTIKALGQTEISKEQPWKEELTDRTK